MFSVKSIKPFDASIAKEKQRKKEREIGWRCYNHAITPITPPNIKAKLDSIENGRIWELKGSKLTIMTSWTSNWDCGTETSWWYIIKDSPFDINMLKAKRRYEITKGNRFYGVSIIDPTQYSEQLLRVTEEAYKTYPHYLRIHYSLESFAKYVSQWRWFKVYAVFRKDDKQMCGYACLGKNENCLELARVKVIPDEEKNGINAALVNAILEDNAELLKGGFFICDGSRNVIHETHYQEYLQKYFGFRKAYCTLNIKYRIPIKILVTMFYPLRKHLKGKTKLIRDFSSLLSLEDIRRSSQIKNI